MRKGNGVRTARVWARMLGCENTVIEGVDWRQDDAGDGGGPRLTVVASVRPYKRQAGRCGVCGKRRPGYDQGNGRRLWRGAARRPRAAPPAGPASPPGRPPP